MDDTVIEQERALLLEMIIASTAEPARGDLCAVARCRHTRLFNFLGFRHPMYCREHKRSGMCNLVLPEYTEWREEQNRQRQAELHLNDEKAQLTPSAQGRERAESTKNSPAQLALSKTLDQQDRFDELFPLRFEPAQLASHRYRGMFCTFRGCQNTTECYGFFGPDPLLIFCKDHRIDGMVLTTMPPFALSYNRFIKSLKAKLVQPNPEQDLVRYCVQDKCHHSRSFGYFGHQPLVCADHMIPGMVDYRGSDGPFFHKYMFAVELRPYNEMATKPDIQPRAKKEIDHDDSKAQVPSPGRPIDDGNEAKALKRKLNNTDNKHVSRKCARKVDAHKDLQARTERQHLLDREVDEEDQAEDDELRDDRDNVDFSFTTPIKHMRTGGFDTDASTTEINNGKSWNMDNFTYSVESQEPVTTSTVVTQVEMRDLISPTPVQTVSFKTDDDDDDDDDDEEEATTPVFSPNEMGIPCADAAPATHTSTGSAAVAFVKEQQDSPLAMSSPHWLDEILSPPQPIHHNRLQLTMSTMSTTTPSSIAGPELAQASVTPALSVSKAVTPLKVEATTTTTLVTTTIAPMTAHLTEPQTYSAPRSQTQNQDLDDGEEEEDLKRSAPATPNLQTPTRKSHAPLHPCEYTNCTGAGRFTFAGLEEGWLCKKHKIDGMTTPIRQRNKCVFGAPDCNNKCEFGFPDDAKPSCCEVHALGVPDLVNLAATRAKKPTQRMKSEL